MSNNFFRFKAFVINQDKTAMKVSTDACLFGAWAANHLVGLSKKTRVLDIGTGTALLSLMLAQKITASIDAVEIDTYSAKQAAENVAESPWKNQITIANKDVKELMLTTAEKYDVIISNPPFYEKELNSPDLRKNFAHHDAALTLEQLLQVIKHLLNADGKFYLLLPYKRFFESLALVKKYNLETVHITLVKQSPAHPHFRFMIAGEHPNNKQQTVKDEISIRGPGEQYSVEFVELLRDYYLHL